MAVLYDGTLATASEDEKIKIWNLSTYTTIKTLQGHSNIVFSVVLLPDGKIATGSADKTIIIWK